MRPQFLQFAAFFAVSLAAITQLARPAEAAPQILGLVASNGLPTPLACHDGFCSANLASFCLQEAREAPNTGRDYRLAPGGTLMLIATLADGRKVARPANDLVTLRTRFGFTTVGVSLPEASVHVPGAVALALEVESATTILPVAATGDRNPQSDEEIARAAGPLRRLAARTFDRPGAVSDAARVIELVVNSLPEEKSRAPVEIAALWQRAAISASAAPNPPSDAGMAMAGKIVESCAQGAAEPNSFTLGICLNVHQTELMTALNRQFWDAAGGS